MHGTYNLTLVILSYAVSVSGSYVALTMVDHYQKAHDADRWPWLVAAAIALGGCAIWAMHFIAMLAFTLPVAVAYSLPVTLGSLLLGIVATGLGLYVAGSRPTTGALIGGGVITGLGAAGMHYMGISAMRMAATMSYNMPLVAISIVIAVVAASVAFWIAFNLTKAWHRIVSAFVMGIAVCGMHYTGMAATTFQASNSGNGMFAATSINSYMIGVWIFAITVVVLGVMVFSSAMHAAGEEA